jgi:pimeloyl-ACP methyl ester carboxylesterase
MKPTIVFLHGLNCSSKIFSHLRTQLPSHNSILVEYDSSQHIEKSYSSVLKQLPEKGSFNIIGHSLGGIIGRLLASRTELPIEKLITISTPFGGSEAAGLLRWFYPGFHVLRDIAPKSPVIKEVLGSVIACDFLSIVSVAGNLPFMSQENDGIVTIKSQVAVPATHRARVNANHFEAVQDAQTVKEISTFIWK